MILFAQGNGKEKPSWGVAQIPKEDWARVVERANTRVQKYLAEQQLQPLNIQRPPVPEKKATQSA